MQTLMGLFGGGGAATGGAAATGAAEASGTAKLAKSALTGTVLGGGSSGRTNRMDAPAAQPTASIQGGYGPGGPSFVGGSQPNASIQGGYGPGGPSFVSPGLSPSVREGVRFTEGTGGFKGFLGKALHAKTGTNPFLSQSMKPQDIAMRAFGTRLAAKRGGPFATALGSGIYDAGNPTVGIGARSPFQLPAQNFYGGVA
jgi:hypothetical protein